MNGKLSPAENRIGGFLGIAAKAGKLIYGTELCREAIRAGAGKKSPYLVLIANDAAEAIAASMAEDTDTVDQDMTGMLSEKVSDKLAYAAVVTVAFILIAIVFAVLGNLINLSFEIPGIGLAEPIVGIILGIIKGIIIMYALTTLVRYLGLVISDEMVESTKLLSGVVNNNPVANRLGL